MSTTVYGTTFSNEEGTRSREGYACLQTAPREHLIAIGYEGFDAVAHWKWARRGNEIIYPHRLTSRMYRKG